MKNKLNDVVILAGGFGSRLQSSIGSRIPKPMAPIGELPLLEHQINLCKKYNYTKILILVHHLSEVITSYFGNGDNFGVEITYRNEPIPRGTAGAIFDNLSDLNDTFIVIYGDTFLDVNLRKFFLSKTDSFEALTFCHPNSHPFDSDLLMLDSNNYVLDVFRPNQHDKTIYRNIVNAALYVFNKSFFSVISNQTGLIDISSDLFQIALKKGKKIKAYDSVEYIKDMGTPERYEKVKNDFDNEIHLKLSDSNKKSCIFLDRDGVINHDVGHLNDINNFNLIDGVEEAIKNFIDQGYIVICVTNQPVLARGEISYEHLDKIHMKMEALLGLKGAYLTKIYFCPHHPDAGFEGEVSDLKVKCNCRKPKPGMILDAVKEFNINLDSSWMIGDHERDILAGKAASLRTILIDSNINSAPITNKTNQLIARNLLDASRYIIEEKN